MNRTSTLRSLAAILALLVLALFATTSYATDLESLIQDLGGEDEAKRVLARQLLPREGIDAVPPLLKLMAHENPVVWRAAKNVLADIGHAVGTPGFEAERHRLAAHLVNTTHSNVPDWTIKHAIRLLGIVAPEGYSIKPLRTLALDPKWREETLGALEVMGTTESRKLLEKLATSGTVEDRVEIIELLRLVSGNVSVKLLRDSEPRIRVAAMRALAERGTPRLIDSFERAMEGIEGELYVEAMDAYLNLAEAIMERGGNWEHGMALFHRVLIMEKNLVHRGAALAGLGRYGDESVVPIIVEATRGEQGRELEAAALMALGSLRGHAGYAAMLDVYPKVGKEVQLGLLGVFGRTRDPMFREALDTAAKDADPAKQAAAQQALKQFELPVSIDTAEGSHPPKKNESTE